MRSIPLACLTLAAYSPFASAQFDAYPWELIDGAEGASQTFVTGDRLVVELSPFCAFGDGDQGFARTLVPESGRFTFNFDGTSLACPAFGGACLGAELVAVSGPCFCPPLEQQAGPACAFTIAEFNGGEPYFNGAFEAVAGSWSIDVSAGDCLLIGAVTGGFSLDCQILATFSKLEFEPALAASSEELSLASGGAIALELTAPAELAGAPYFVLGSASGTQPGLQVGPLLVPLAVDDYFLLSLANPPSSPLTAAAGVLDSEGRATAGFALLPASPPALAGLVLHHAGVVLTPGPPSSLGFVTGAVPLALLP